MQKALTLPLQTRSRSAAVALLRQNLPVTGANRLKIEGRSHPAPSRMTPRLSILGISKPREVVMFRTAELGNQRLTLR